MLYKCLPKHLIKSRIKLGQRVIIVDASDRFHDDWSSPLEVYELTVYDIFWRAGHKFIAMRGGNISYECCMVDYSECITTEYKRMEIPEWGLRYIV